MDSKVKQLQVQQKEIGNYHLLNLIGRGGFADVYLAEHTYLQTQVALKIFRERSGDEQMEQFLTQIRNFTHLQHAHILPILSCDVHEGHPFLVMPHVTGGTLRQRHPRGSQLSVETVLAYLHQIAPALDAAHGTGQLHGDIKPENMLLSEKDELLLSDFGLAPVVRNIPGEFQASVTGTVTYMAPEQLSGQPEPASDQYALGILIYEWLRGEPPFAGTYTEVATQHALINPPSLRQYRPDLTPQFEQVLLRALAKSPRERFENIQEFASTLEQAINAPIPQNQATKPGISRRALVLSLVSAGGVIALGAGLTWKWFANATQSTLLPLYTYNGHTDKVYSLSWSPDSTRLVSVDLSGNAQVWQAVTEGQTARGKLLASRKVIPAVTLAGNGEATGLAWAPHTEFIALGDSSGNILVWESASNQNHLVLRDYPNLGTCVAWSPDGTRLAAVCLNAQSALMVVFWDTTNGNRLADLQLISQFTVIATIYTPAPLLLAWSPDSKRLALSNGRGATQVWELPGGHTLFTLPVGPNNLAWSPDGKYLATDNQIWDAANGNRLHTYTIDSQAVAWSPDGKYLATGGKEMHVSIWETSTEKRIHTYQGHTAPINAVHWSPDGSLIASASDDQTVRIFTNQFA